MLGNLMHGFFGINSLSAWLGYEEGHILIQTYSMKIPYSINKNCTYPAKSSKTENYRTF